MNIRDAHYKAKLKVSDTLSLPLFDNTPKFEKYLPTYKQMNRERGRTLRKQCIKT